MPRTSKWRVLVADDEPAARRGVRQLLDGYPRFAVVGESRNGREVLDALDVLKPDVLFLDIQMPEVDGFEVIRRRTPERMPATVFLTAYDQFAIRAFDAEAHDYLVKPVSEARFDATIRRLVKRLEPGGSVVTQEQGIVVPTRRGIVVIRPHEIDWVEAAGNYARVWTAGRSYLLRESLGRLERRVSAPLFARAHRQALVRVAAVRALEPTEAGELIAVLDCGTRIQVSRRRRGAFAAALRRHCHGRGEHQETS